MKKFKFRLQSLLRYREFLERRAQLEAADIQSRIRICEDAIRRHREQYDSILKDFEKELQRGIRSERYTSFTAYLGKIESDMETDIQHRKKLFDELARKQQELMKRSVHKKVMVNFKQKQTESYYSRMLKDIQKETDEMIIMRKTRDGQI